MKDGYSQFVRILAKPRDAPKVLLKTAETLIGPEAVAAIIRVVSKKLEEGLAANNLEAFVEFVAPMMEKVIDAARNEDPKAVNMEDILAKLQSITQLAVRDPTKAPNALFDLATELLGKDAMDALVKV